MAFIDEYQFDAKAGKGGDGVVRWLHMKGKEFGGPAGGDGGKGGDVYIRAVRDVALLAKYRSKNEFIAEDGGSGGAKKMKGKNGEDMYIDLPVGSVVTNTDTYETFELMEEGETHLVLAGGEGGLGNDRFKSSRNVNPKESTPGQVGQEGHFTVELRLIADIGLVGMPNAGKSSLLNALTKAEAKIGAYPFTTLEPNLGVLYGRVIADIPGLIEGASEGKGVGHKFLRHVSRTRMLVHCVSCEHENVKEAYETIRAELKAHGDGLAEKDEMILLTKTDMCEEEEVQAKKDALAGYGKRVEEVTVLDDDAVKRIGEIFVGN
jgi:GTP-binding protein